MVIRFGVRRCWCALARVKVRDSRSRLLGVCAHWYLGWMRWRIGADPKLAGYPYSGTISIEYDIPSGVQSERHQHPNVPFLGTKRIAYLPDTPEGREILILFIHAFVRVSPWYLRSPLYPGPLSVAVVVYPCGKVTRARLPRIVSFIFSRRFVRFCSLRHAK